jgi:23S rRNA pseudouridine2605 synthase
MGPTRRPNRSAKPNRSENRGRPAAADRTASSGQSAKPGRSTPSGRPARTGGRVSGSRPAASRVRREQRPGDSVPAARGVLPPRAEDVSESLNRTRLQKFLAAAGVDSRRNCESYIRDGRVTVDNEVVTDPAAGVDPETQDIRLDGERLKKPRYKYFVLNKPKGVLCTNSDPQGRVRAVDLIPSHGQRLFTVGRLDESTEGLLLITNDGDLAQRLAHPRFEVVRRYRCHVAGLPSDEILNQLREGMYFSDGFFRFRGIKIVKRQGRSTILELELREGKNREIRRLLAKVGHKVIVLERIAFGPLRLGSLPPGKHRELGTREVADLRRDLEELERNGGDRISERRPLRRPTRERSPNRIPAEASSSGSGPGPGRDPRVRTPRAAADSRAVRNPAGGRTPGRPGRPTDPQRETKPFELRPEKPGPAVPRPAGPRPASGSARKRRPSGPPKGKPASGKRVEINKGRDRRRR